jgi:hypothetical protein
MDLPIRSTNKSDYIAAVIDEEDPVYNQYEDMLADIGKALEEIRDNVQYIENSVLNKDDAEMCKNVVDGICQLILLTE